ncbi:hypothetical protein AB0J35_54895 [Nonomuraea angiospora]
MLALVDDDTPPDGPDGPVTLGVWRAGIGGDLDVTGGGRLL